MYTLALGLNPDSRESCIQIGIIYKKLGSDLKAVEFFEKAVLGWPNNSSGLFHLVETYRSKNRKIEAIDLFKRALQNDPTDWEGWGYLALTYLENKDFAGAIRTFEKAILLNPTNNFEVTYHYYLGFAYLNLNIESSSILHYNEAIELSKKLIGGVVFLEKYGIEILKESVNKAIDQNLYDKVEKLLEASKMILSLGKTTIPDKSFAKTEGRLFD